MNSRERVAGAIERTGIDRIPFYYDELFIDTERRDWLTEGMPATITEREELFGYDFTELFIDSSMRFEPELIEENDETMTVADKYGFVAVRNKLIPGIHYKEHPVKTPEDWQRLKERLSVDFDQRSRIHEVSYGAPFEVWPGWAEAKDIFTRKHNSGRHVTCRIYGPWELIWRLRGFTEAMMDFYDNWKMIEDIIEHFTEFIIDVIKKAISYGIKPDSLFLIEDLGDNRGLLFSPETIRELFGPCYKQIGDFLKSQSIYYFLHSCGDVRSLLPMFIDAGVRVLNPLQATVMDVVELKKEFGEQLTFLGNINSRIMHDKEAIMEELNRKIPVAMANGGFVFACDHSIPAEVSFENYLAILKEARRLGRYK